jgi:hypothetical protein
VRRYICDTPATCARRQAEFPADPDALRDNLLVLLAKASALMLVQAAAQAQRAT